MTAQAGGLPREDTDVLALARNGTLAGQWGLVPAESSAEFANRHFWNAITVHGRFGRAQLTIDRSRFGMTWSPLRISSLQATGSVTATFTRATTG